MIPRKIHYCWFGGGAKPALVRKCIASWRRFCPDWEIVEWNESNMGVARSRFAADAYAARKWGFVPDPLRMMKIHEEGGVYLDTDVELIAPIDGLVSGGAFFACERDEPKVINPGLGFAAEPGSPVLKAIVERYETLTFDPACHMEQASPCVVTEVLRDFPDVRCLPARVMNPMGNCAGRVRMTPDTVAIHHYAASWFNWKQTLAYKVLPRIGVDVGALARRFRPATGCCRK